LNHPCDRPRVFLEEGFQAVFLVANHSGGGILKLVGQEQELAPNIAVPRTNGWHAWTPLCVDNVVLPVSRFWPCFSSKMVLT
jgi:hypothetical protein